jgi:hypothetical protein
VDPLRLVALIRERLRDHNDPMTPDVVERTIYIVGGIVALFVLGGLGLFVAFRLRGPTAAKVVATEVIGLGDSFDWTVRTTASGRHVLWMTYRVEYEGHDSSDVAFRLRMSIDDAPSCDYLYNLEAEPGAGGMQGQWFEVHRNAGDGTGSLSATIWVCGFRPRPAGTLIRLRGTWIAGGGVRGGGAELKLSRK